ncbi:TetR/AcrR family transcriptional regulator [Phytohabitans suffuscus]|uniref:TetR family transcriptional regulator n=1 Tax=Phytohabitans suffuscus TaxID=624315 RepID=A0A6F8YER4_9ACTN|nr:TetR/AcrR family transcriptional regulator [Phytohabitans suffuscus]BCB84592.1 TetR family transcriptional regulator [Phytohabitans suffuscus]
MAGGRPRGFDVEEALDRAVEVFWRQGYDGTSIADLTEAMGINPPSLYAAFGNKRSLFDRAVDHYSAARRHYVETAVAQPTALAAARTLLAGVVEAATQPDLPAGCLTIQGGLACSDSDREVAAALAQRRRATQEAMLARFEKAVEDGDLPPDTDCDVLAGYVATVAQGLNVQAASGVSRDRLLAFAEAAMAAIPRPRVEASHS